MLKTIKNGKLFKLNQSGVAHLLYPILGIVVVAVIAGAGFFVYQQNNSGAGGKIYRYGFKVKVYKLSPSAIDQCASAIKSRSLCKANSKVENSTATLLVLGKKGDTCNGAPFKESSDSAGNLTFLADLGSTRDPIKCTSKSKPNTANFYFGVADNYRPLDIEYWCNSKGNQSVRPGRVCTAHAGHAAKSSGSFTLGSVK